MSTDWKAARAAKFPDEILHAAQQAERETGCPAAMTLAQWYDESADGKHMAGANNPFGMKYPDSTVRRQLLTAKGCHPAMVATHEDDASGSHAVTAPFIAFPDVATAFWYHGYHLMDPHGPYGEVLHILGRSFQAWVAAVSPIYATNPTYGHDLLALVDEYHLMDIDLGPRPL